MDGWTGVRRRKEDKTVNGAAYGMLLCSPLGAAVAMPFVPSTKRLARKMTIHSGCLTSVMTTALAGSLFTFRSALSLLPLSLRLCFSPFRRSPSVSVNAAGRDPQSPPCFFSLFVARVAVRPRKHGTTTRNRNFLDPAFPSV